MKKVFIRSGIRFDYLIYDEDRTFLRELCEHHVSGQLKVAPEHISNAVLEKMGKPSVEVYKKFVKAYKDMNEKLGKKQYLVPYLMEGQCTETAAAEQPRLLTKENLTSSIAGTPPASS